MGKQHKKLILLEREQIAILKAKGSSLREIASILGRSHSTLSRELKRNQVAGHYVPLFAQMDAHKRASSSRRKPRISNQQIRRYVRKKLKLSWSPEQISGRLVKDYSHLSISHEAIYQFVYYDAPELIGFLPRKKPRRPRYRRRSTHQLRIPSRTSIERRPKIINERRSLGHWESDSIVSRANQASLHILHERKSRLIRLTKLDRNTASNVVDCITRRLKGFPQQARVSITYDNGTENTRHLEVNRQLKTNSYFCQPYHSWEKGAVENSAGLVRRFLPKKTDFKPITDSFISRIEFLINNRPRKCLNYQTPQEVFNSLRGAIKG